MRKNIFIIIFILIAIAAATLWTSYKTSPSIIIQSQSGEVALTAATAAPDFSFAATDGRKADLAQFKGKLVILHFWATWCPPCIEEFPKLVEVSKDMEQDVVLLAVSSDKSRREIERFMGKFDLSQNAYIIQDSDRAITHDLYQTFTYPETILIDRDGKMVRKIAGDADWTSPEMRSILQDLAEKPPTP